MMQRYASKRLSKEERRVDALALRAEERRDKLRKACLLYTSGKGVSFMENAAGWHGKAPNDEEYEIAMADLEKAGEALCQK